MNATPTTLSDVLWRWQRGIARALLLTGALAGMSLGTVAYAQIAFRNASSAAALQAPAAPTASPGTTNTITFVNPAGAMVAGSGTSLTPVIPAGTAAGDFAVLIIVGRPPNGDTTQPAAPTGWSGPRSSVLNTGPSPDLRLITFYKVLAGGDADPVVTVPSGWRTTSNGMSAQIAVWRGVDTTTPFDVADTTNTSAAVQNWVPPTITTATDGAWVVSAVGTSDDNRLGLLAGSEQGFQPRMTGAAYDESANVGDFSIALADIEKATAGATTMPTWRQTFSASDSWAGITFALRPARNVLTITQPTGTVAGDVLVASIGFRPFCCDTPAANYTIAPVVDSGTPWTPLPRLDNAPGAGILPSNSLAVYWKVAGASEPAAYRWSFSVTAPTTFDAAAGGILKFSGVEDVAPVIGVEENGRQTTAGDQTTPSITTPAVNTMLVTSHSFASPSPWTTPPAGMTEVVDVQAGSQTTGIFYGVQSVVGPTGQKRAIPTPDDDIGNAHILALRSATPDTALTIPIPPGTVANDVMIAAITVRGTDRTITPPVAPFDWVEVRRTEQTTGTANLQVFYVRAAGASEPADYTWTLALGNTGNVGGILSFSGVDTTAPIVSNAIDAHGGNLSPGTGGAITATGITTNVANTVAVSAHSFASTANWSPVAPVDVPSRRVPRGDGISLAMYHYPAQALPGATGDKTATATNDADTGIGQILALKPPPPAPAVGGFNAYETSTAAGAITGVIKTKIAGSTISLDMIALNAAKTAIATGFTGTVRVEVLNSSDNTGALDANGCRPTWTVIQTLSPDPAFVAGDNGRKTVTFTQPNSFRDVRMRISFPTTSPTAIGCSNDNFAIRPSSITVSATDATWATAGNTRTLNNVAVSGGTVHKAGSPFRVTAVAQPVTVTQYAGTPTVKTATCLLLGTMTACADGTFTLPGGAWSGAAGTRTNDSATYSEVGALTFELEDQDFASVDAADSTTAERFIPQTGGTIQVGRFVPDRFVIAPANTPQFRTFGAACAGTRSFTYIGQFFNYVTPPVAMVTAQNAAGGTTTNYRESLWKITTAAPTDVTQTYSNNGVGPTLDTTQANNAPTVTSLNDGTGTVTVSTLDRISYQRTTPIALFNANISLTITVRDDSEADGQITASTVTPFNAIAFDSGNEFRFGRLAVRNANGSQLVPLPVQLEAQYWSGAPTNAFITNAADNCTTIATNNTAMSNFTNNLAACETAITAVGAFSSGRSTLTLAAPGSANNGSVDLTVNLGASASGNTCTAVGAGPGPLTTTANLPYLQGNWTGGAYNVNPSARATFGVFKGAEEVIFQRENF